MEVRSPYYLARCSECGFTDSSEAFDEARHIDDADIVCPKCGCMDVEEVMEPVPQEKL